MIKTKKGTESNGTYIKEFDEYFGIIVTTGAGENIFKEESKANEFIFMTKVAENYNNSPIELISALNQ